LAATSSLARIFIGATKLLKVLAKFIAQSKSLLNGDDSPLFPRVKNRAAT